MAEHWEVCAAGIALLVSVLNVATRHYSDATGIGRLLLVAIDVLSVLVSAGAKPWVKLPGTLSPQPPVDIFQARVNLIKKRQKECARKQPPSP